MTERAEDDLGLTGLADQTFSFVFLVSHMRSYSSLLGHLLAQTRSIDGYSELHRAYTTEDDLERMASDVRATLDGPLMGDRLFDKLLHRACTIDPAIVARDDVRIILSVRTPAATLASLVALGSRDDSVRWAADPERALLHYQRRLEDIRELAKCAPDAALLVADDLFRSPRSILDEIGVFLGLDEPVPEHYRLQPLTGHKRSGDSSAKIRSGVIRNDPVEADGEVPPAVVAAGVDAFNAALAGEELRALTPLGGPHEYLS